MTVSNTVQATEYILTSYLESKSPDLVNEVEPVLNQVSPNITHGELSRSPTSLSNVQFEMDDLLVRVDGNSEARARQISAMSHTEDHGNLLHSASDILLLRSTSYYSGSALQPQETLRPPLLTDPDFLYRSKSFKFLISLDVFMFATPLTMVCTMLWMGDPNPSAYILSYKFFAIGLLIILFPQFVWVALVMPFSSATKG